MELNKKRRLKEAFNGAERDAFLSENFPLSPIFIALFWYSQEIHLAVFYEFVWMQLATFSVVAGWNFSAFKGATSMSIVDEAARVETILDISKAYSGSGRL